MSVLKRNSKKQQSRLCYSVNEASNLTGFSRVYIYRLIEAGDWPSVKEGNSRQSRRVIPAKFLHEKFNMGHPPVAIDEGAVQ